MRALALLAAASLATASTPPGGEAARPPAKVDPKVEAMERFSKGDYLRPIEAFEKAAFGPSGEIADNGAYQMWSQMRPMIGGLAPPPRTAATAPPLAAEDAARLRAASVRNALSVIRAEAAKTRIVILNEAHHRPRDRAFALEVARALRPLGYDILAAEAFTNVDGKIGSPVARLERQRYPTFETGHYIHDPVFADFIRGALAIGYRPAAYEIRPSQWRPDGGIAVREQAQAENIAAILASNPGARLFIHVGFSHVMEAPAASSEGEMEWMAARLKKMTGIDPLTIDQANFGEASSARRGLDARALVEPRIRESSVLRLGAGAANVGDFAHSVDLQVFHPRTRLIHGRPDWLVRMGRTARPVPSSLLPVRGRRLVQAFLAGEKEGAIPIDQVLVEAGKPAPWLMLPRRPVRYAVQD
ncbi:MAG TPA: hypothetical protein VF652_06460 [Allosphingosinicella sp.]